MMKCQVSPALTPKYALPRLHTILYLYLVVFVHQMACQTRPPRAHRQLRAGNCQKWRMGRKGSVLGRD